MTGVAIHWYNMLTYNLTDSIPINLLSSSYLDAILIIGALAALVILSGVGARNRCAAVMFAQCL
jgi:hypothetical protein